MIPGRLRTGLLAATAFLSVFVAYQALSWSSVQALLAADAGRRSAEWEHGFTPWRWQFARENDVIWPGSVGLERIASADVEALSGVVRDGNVDLSLNLRGEAADLPLADGALLQLVASAPLHVSMFADAGSSAFALGQADVESGEHTIKIPFGKYAALPARELRLHLEGAPGTHVALRTLALTARDASRPAACDDLRHCQARVPRIAAPRFALPESLLAWRDALLVTRPAAIIETATRPAPSQASLAPALLAGPAFWMLAFAPLLVGLASRMRPATPSRALALTELALVFAPCLAFQWMGFPAEDTPARVDWIFAGGLAGALMLKPEATCSLLGNRTAWGGLRAFVIASIAVLGLIAAANALDGDGFGARPLTVDKAWRYPLWAVVQQWILLNAIGPRTRRALGSDFAGAIAAGSVFGLLHLPNFALMVATCLAGSAWAWLGYRHRALLPLAATHAVTGLALLWIAPPWLLRSAEVGGRYLMLP